MDKVNVMINEETCEEKTDNTLRDVFENQLARVEYWELNIELFKASLGQLRHLNFDEETKKAYSCIYGKLYEELSNAYRDLFMMAVFNYPEGVLKAKRIAYNKFLSENHGVMHLMNKTGYYPGIYRAQDEEMFKEIIRKEIEEEK